MARTKARQFKEQMTERRVAMKKLWCARAAQSLVHAARSHKVPRELYDERV
jgi:hypothetical protein